MKRVQKPNVASHRVAEVLAERILTGELRPGERIKQDELAAELETSRIPVRDALRMLESRGLVSLKANVGARVTRLSLKDMDVSYQIREQLEPMLLAESIPNLSAEDLAEMERVKSRLDSVTDIDDYLPLSREFHWISFRGHEVPLLAQIVERLWDTTQIYRRAYAKLSLQDPERMQIMRDERALLFGAIRRREVDLAPRILAMHIRRTHMALLKFSHLHDLLAS